MKSIKRFLFSQQTSIFSAATVIMIMIIGSRLLGLVRQRILVNFFGPNDLTLFFAAFRLPDLIFEVLIYGTFASAFIPVFTRALKDTPSASRQEDNNVWETASSVMNIGLLIFLALAVIVIIFANQLYGILVPGFGPEHRETIVFLSRILFAAQGFFVISYVLTAVLESSRRFLMPAIAPLFYNLGIILGTVLLSSHLGLLGPVIGVVIGAASHALIQLPSALKLGFRFSFKIKLNSDVKKIGRLSLPRIIEIAFLQVAKSVELFLASLISTAAYTYFTFGNSLQMVPVGLFGTSIAKAALPTLSGQAESKEKFRGTLLNALYQVTFLVLPLATVLLVLRIPLVRLAFGTNLFNWESTVQTGMVVSAFGVGVIFQVWVSILARGFYALHDTKTPVVISIFSMLLNIALDFILIRGFGMPVWGLAAAFTFAYFIQTLLLFWVMVKRVYEHFSFGLFFPFIKSFIASSCSGLAMYFVLKVFDKSVWDKRPFPLFEKFVLDTRYTVNLLILTGITVVVGILVYLFISVVFKSRELAYFIDFVKRRKIMPVEPPLDKI